MPNPSPTRAPSLTRHASAVTRWLPSCKTRAATAYWHFAQGLLLQSFAQLVDLDLYHRNLSVSFSNPRNFKFARYLPFYLALFDRPPTFTRRCPPTSVRVLFSPWRVPIQRGHPAEEFLMAGNSTLVRDCARLPRLHRAALQVRGVPTLAKRSFHALLVRRLHRAAANGAELEEQLADFASTRRVSFRAAVLENMSLLAQVDLLLQTDVLFGYHGSGVGAGHFWMAVRPRAAPAPGRPPARLFAVPDPHSGGRKKPRFDLRLAYSVRQEGSVGVELAPPGWWYCVFSTCAAASGKAWLQSTSALTGPAVGWKPVRAVTARRPHLTPRLLLRTRTLALATRLAGQPLPVCSQGGWKAFSSPPRMQRRIQLDAVLGLLSSALFTTETTDGSAHAPELSPLVVTGSASPRDLVEARAARVCVPYTSEPAPSRRRAPARANRSTGWRDGVECAWTCAGRMIQVWEPRAQPPTTSTTFAGTWAAKSRGRGKTKSASTRSVQG